jgi:hypothetical protein
MILFRDAAGLQEPIMFAAGWTGKDASRGHRAALDGYPSLNQRLVF